MFSSVGRISVGMSDDPGRTSEPGRAAVVAVTAAITLILILAGLAVATTRTTGHLAVPPAGSSTDPADLIGVDWLLSQYVTPDGVTHASHATSAAGVSFSATNQFGFTDGCNDYGGSIAISAGTLTIGDLAGTLVGCPREPPIVEVLQHEVTWYITRRVLTITAHSGEQLIFVVRSSPYPSVYPGSTAVAFLSGHKGTAIYRLYYKQTEPGSFYLTGDLRQSPQRQWQGIGGGEQKIGWRGPVPDRLQGCYAATFARDRFTTGWATAKTKRVVVRNSRDTTVTDIPLYDLPGTGNLRVFAGFTHHLQGVTTIHAYDAAGKPLGPGCAIKP